MIAIIALYIILGIIFAIVILLHFSIRADIAVENKEIDIKLTYFGFQIYPRRDKKKEKPLKASVEKDISKNIKSKESSDTPLSADEIDELLKQLDDEKKKTVEENVSSKEESNSRKTYVKQEKCDNNIKNKISESEDVKSAEDNSKDTKTKSSIKEKFNDIKEKWKIIKPYIPTSWKAVKKLLKTIRFCKTSIVIAVGKEDAYDSALNYGKVNAAVFNSLSLLQMIFTVKLKKCDVQCVFNENTFKYDINTRIYIRPSAVIAIAFCTLINFAIIFFKQRRKDRKKSKLNKLKKVNNEKELLLNE